MSNLDESRLDRFCARAAAAGEVWVLTEGEDCAVVESNDYEESEVMPFWSTKADAERATAGDWAVYTPQSIPLDEFVGSWLPTLDEDDYLVGPDWNDDLEGDEVEPAELFRRLETARASGCDTLASMIVLDGTYGEGGGALLRTALAMSAVTEQPVRIDNVRGETRFPGLDPEDLTLVRALAESTAAETTGAEIGSNTLAFLPTRRPKALNGKLATVRSGANRGPNALIVLNALLPVLARSGAYSTVECEGETYGSGALGYDAFAEGTLAVLRRAGLHAFPDLSEAGYGRESRGCVSLDVEPSALTGLKWTERGKALGLRARVVASGIPRDVGERAAAHLRRLAQNSGLEMEAEAREVPSGKPGLHVTVWAEYERGHGGGAAMGGRGVQAEALAQAAFAEATAFMETGACLDPYLADQVLLPLVLAEEPSAFRVSHLTQRFLTAVWVVKRFTPIRLTVRGSENHAGLITIEK